MASGVQIGRGYIAVDVNDSKAKAALQSFGSFASTAFKAVGIATGVAGAAVVKMAFQFNALKEQSLIAFGTLLHSGDKAQQMFSNLQKFAAATPFELPGLIDNARQLLGVGVAADKVIPTLTSLGDAAGALGINQDRFNNILLATTQAMGKGKLQGDDLMQMVENGIPVWQLLSEATGKPIPELQKLSSAGKLLAADTFPKLFAQMEKDYGGSMAKQALTLSGVWSSLKDNTKILSGTALEPLFTLVKRGIGTLGDLASSGAGQKFAENFAAHLQGAISAVENFGHAVKMRFGDEFHNAMDKAKDAGSNLWDSIKADAVPVLADLGKTLITILPSLIQLAQSMSGVLRPALDAIKIVMTAVADNAGNFARLIATAAGTVAAIAGPAIEAFGNILKVVGTVLAQVVRLVGDLATPIGVAAGVVLASIVAFKALSTVMSGVGTAISAIKPSTIVDALAPMNKKIDNVALSAGVMTERFTGSANAGERVATAGSKVGTVLTKVGSALPLVGVGIAAIGSLFELSAQHADDLRKAGEDLGKSLALGGTKGVEAAKKLQELENQLGSTKTKLDEFNAANEAGAAAGSTVASGLDDDYSNLKTQIDSAKKSLVDYKNELGPVGLAQAQQAQAQQDYNAAVDKFGASSAEANAAQGSLIQRTADVEKAQRDAASATKDHTQSLFDLTSASLAAANSDLQLRQSQQAVAKAMTDLTKVQQDGKATDDEKTAAELNLEQSMLRSAEAARQKAVADNNGKSSADQAKAANAAYAGEVLRMAEAAGSNAPASLLKMVAGLDGASLSALGAKVSTNNLGQAVISLPGQKDIVLSAPNSQALNQIAEVQRQLDEAQRRAQINVTVRQNAQAALGAGVGGGLSFTNPSARVRARGGDINPDGPYLVGEEGPEIVWPARPGYVSSHQDSKQMLSGMGSGGGDTFIINGQNDPHGTALYVQRVQRINSRLR